MPINRTDVVDWPHFYCSDFQSVVESGQKTRTARLWGTAYSDRYVLNVGRLFRALRSYGKDTQFGWVRMLSVGQERFGDTTLQDLKDEGCGHLTMKQFKTLKFFKGCKDSTLLWVVRFVFFAVLPNP